MKILCIPHLKIKFRNIATKPQKMINFENFQKFFPLRSTKVSKKVGCMGICRPPCLRFFAHNPGLWLKSSFLGHETSNMTIEKILWKPLFRRVLGMKTDRIFGIFGNYSFSGVLWRYCEKKISDFWKILCIPRLKIQFRNIATKHQKMINFQNFQKFFPLRSTKVSKKEGFIGICQPSCLRFLDTIQGSPKSSFLGCETSNMTIEKFLWKLPFRRVLGVKTDRNNFFGN
jgi:hypothetical protein